MRGWVLCCILVLLCDSSSGQKLQSCTHKHVSVDGRIMMTTIACEMKNTGNGLFSAPPDSFVLTVTGGKKNGNSISSEVVPITNGEGVWETFRQPILKTITRGCMLARQWFLNELFVVFLEVRVLQ